MSNLRSLNWASSNVNDALQLKGNVAYFLHSNSQLLKDAFEQSKITFIKE